MSLAIRYHMTYACPACKAEWRVVSSTIRGDICHGCHRPNVPPCRIQKRLVNPAKYDATRYCRAS